MDANQVNLSTLDVCLLVLSLAISVLIGLYFANKNENIDAYMLGGRNQKLLPVSMSMMTSFVSGLTLIGCPAEFYYHGPYYATVVIANLLWVPFSAFILLPVFHRLGHVSVNQYLELRYNVWLKRIVSVVFMIQMTLYNAVVLYVPSLSLKSALGISESISIGVVGVSCIVYSTFGGIKAVIWTDFFQFGLMFASLLAICYGGTLEAGGFDKLIEINRENNRLSLDDYFNFDFATRHTLYTIVSGALLLNIFTNGANQIQIQRALTLPTLRIAQYSQLLTGIFTALIIFIASYIGLALFAVYKDCDPFKNQEIDKRDTILIYYVSTHLADWPGLRGIFVAGIFAATLSTLSSFQNSMSALFMADFVKPLSGLKLNDNEKQTMYIGKIVALLFGVACIGLTFVVGRISGLLEVALKLLSTLGAPLLVAFFLGMLTRFTNAAGILTAVIGGYSFGLYIELVQTFQGTPLEPSLPMSTLGCRVMNGSTLSADDLLIRARQQNMDENKAFDIRHISYLWLPVFEMAISGSLAVIVSLLTGGWRQQIDDKYLVAWKHKSRKSHELGKLNQF